MAKESFCRAGKVRYSASSVIAFFNSTLCWITHWRRWIWASIFIPPSSRAPPEDCRSKVDFFNRNSSSNILFRSSSRQSDVTHCNMFYILDDGIHEIPDFRYIIMGLRSRTESRRIFDGTPNWGTFVEFLSISIVSATLEISTLADCIANGSE